MSRTPIVRPVSWVNAIINLAIISAFVAMGWFFFKRNGAIIGIASYLILSFFLRAFFASSHRRAIAYCKQKEFAKAIPQFENSLAFFKRNAWIDKYRAITMLSVAGMCYREMALVSLGFCYGQLSEGEKARSLYRQCLKEFPESGMAEAALRLMDSAAIASTNQKQ